MTTKRRLRTGFTTGRRSENFFQALFEKLSEEAFIQIGDFFKMSLEDASNRDFKKIILAAFFGKAVKMAQGVPHTHAARMFTGSDIDIQGIIFDFSGEVVFDSDSQWAKQT